MPLTAYSLPLLLFAAWLCRLTWSRSNTYTSHLDMWIAGKEVEQFVGVPMDIYVIKDGSVVPYLQDVYLDAHLPILPPEVETVEILWFAHDDVYRYRFSDLRSLDPYILYNPLLSIPLNGTLPRHKTAFYMTIPCTRHVTAVASMYIALHVHSSSGMNVPGSPLKLHIRKRCIAFETRNACPLKCLNDGRCSLKTGRCICKRGFYGAQCGSAACFPLCLNNGSCVRPGECLCLDGFIGDRCETVVCRRTCQNGGICGHPNQCICPEGFYGSRCEYKAGKCKGTCRNGALCMAYNRCKCRPGYFGELCKLAKCSRSCGSHGRCTAPNQCKCHRGWRGRRCNKKRNNFSKLNSRRKRRGRRAQTGIRNRQRRKTRKNRKRKKMTTTTDKMPFKVQPTVRYTT